MKNGILLALFIILCQCAEARIIKGKIKDINIEAAVLQFIAMNFGFVFLDASYGDKLVGICKEEYIRNSVEVFVNGINSK